MNAPLLFEDTLTLTLDRLPVLPAIVVLLPTLLLDLTLPAAIPSIVISLTATFDRHSARCRATIILSILLISPLLLASDTLSVLSTLILVASHIFLSASIGVAALIFLAPLLLSLTLFDLALTLLLSGSLLLLPSIITSLDLSRSLTTPVAAILCRLLRLSLSLLRLSRHRRWRRAALYRLLWPFLSLNRLLGPLSSLRRLLRLLTTLLGLLTLLLSCLSPIISIFPTAALSASISGKTHESYAAYRDREAESV